MVLSSQFFGALFVSFKDTLTRNQGALHPTGMNDTTLVTAWRSRAERVETHPRATATWPEGFLNTRGNA